MLKRNKALKRLTNNLDEIVSLDNKEVSKQNSFLILRVRREVQGLSAHPKILFYPKLLQGIERSLQRSGKLGST